MEHLDAGGIRMLSTAMTVVFLPFTGIAISLSRRSRRIDPARQFALSIAITVSSASLFVMLLSWGGMTCEFLPASCQ